MVLSLLSGWFFPLFSAAPLLFGGYSGCVFVFCLEVSASGILPDEATWGSRYKVFLGFAS